MEENSSLTVTTSNGPLTVLFQEATSPALRRQCYALAGGHFGQPLAIEQHEARDEYLSNRPLTTRGGWRVWCLVRLADESSAPSSSTIAVVATCKTIRREFLVREGHEGKTREEEGYCIASVITHAQYRRLGLASFLMRKTAEWIDDHRSGGGGGGRRASVLYSSAADFYVGFGWAMYDALQADILAFASPSDVEGWSDLPPTRLLTRDDTPGLCERDVEILKAEMDEHQLAPDAVLVANSPSANMVSWQHDRCDFISLRANGRAPEIKGVICEEGDTWAYWYHDFRAEVLAIQRVAIPNKPSLRRTEMLVSLLLHACEEAEKWKFSKVVIWNPAPEVRDALKLLEERRGARYTLRERVGSDVPSFRWRKWDGEKEVVMVPNEFYAWA
ncbi:hypothetical protein GE09DRAFT_1122100 [Coniochaeta sp. 2T2.1]|nr:hypothetical protein GE09DRAFT_1122100 [Coniochaeta sp. 2T2.1]